MKLDFAGDLTWWQGVILAAVFAWAAWRIYRRDVRPAAAGWLRYLLPVLRCLAVFALLLCLTGPVLTHRYEEGRLGRVMIFVDGSESMSVEDDQMDNGRKLLIAASRGMVPEGALDMTLAEVTRALGTARRRAAGATPRRRVQARGRQVNLLLKEVEKIRDMLAGLDPAFFPAAEQGARDLTRLHRAFASEIVEPATQLAQRKPKRDAPATRTALGAIAAALEPWERRCAEAFAAYATTVIESGGPTIRTAIREFDATSRWKRAESLLLDGLTGLLPTVRNTHEVEVMSLVGSDVKRLWHSATLSDVPERLEGEPDGHVTNLSDGIRETMGGEFERTAIVLLSDGRHNDGSPPAALAQVLGKRTIPIFTVGLGNHIEPRDLAIMDVDGPPSVYADDRLQGHVFVKDRMPAGSAITLRITHEGREIWKKELQTADRGVREVEFDVSVKELASGKLEGMRGVQVMSLPVKLQAAIDPITGEAKRDNNTATFHFRVVTHGRRVLLLDGRPRWETRFIRNLFDRDEQWRIDPLIVDLFSDQKGWSTGDGAGRFPEDRESLYAYGLIVFGEVPPDMFKDDELEWISDFVEKRGGGIVFIDGRRGYLTKYGDTPLGAMVPVEWIEGLEGRAPDHLEITDAGAQRAAFRIQKDAEANAALWRVLPKPHWVASVRALEGTETAVEAVMAASPSPANDDRSPALVTRRFGAGKVLYCAFDASWRWRYEVADQYHSKYWNQIATWLMETPYAVKDKYVSLDVGGPTYAAGDRAGIRVRLRDRTGTPLVDATAEAIVFRDGKKFATVALEPDPNLGGIYRGRTAELQPGSYEVGVAVAGFSELQMKARTTFTVQPRTAKEFTVLTCDEELLRDMAEESGGAYLREEDAAALASLLMPFSEGTVVTTETHLAASYWWFVPIMLLLTFEWIIRKRVGML